MELADINSWIRLTSQSCARNAQFTVTLREGSEWLVFLHHARAWFT
jgi:hypothetical protein